MTKLVLHSCGIALGANLGDPRVQLVAAREALRLWHEGGADEFLVAPLYESDPVDCADGAPVFLNTVLEFRTQRTPEEVLELTQAIEFAAGRPAEREHHAPRALDLDVLYLGDETRQGDGLVLPHPRIAERAFVLEPLASIRPSLILPGTDRTVADLLADLRATPAHDDNSLRLLAETW